MDYNIATKKTREKRVKKTAEVFTPPFLVNKMFDKLPSEVWLEGKTVCDPACGDGEFLIWTLMRKIQHGHKPLNALKTIYGVELMPDNVIECQARLLKIISYYQPITEKHIKVVLTNIVCHDALTYDFEFTTEPTIQEIQDFNQKLSELLTQVKVPHDLSAKRNTLLGHL